MGRGANSCLFCKQVIIWKSDDASPRGLGGRWLTAKDGGSICSTAPDHKHRLAPSS